MKVIMKELFGKNSLRSIRLSKYPGTSTIPSKKTIRRHPTLDLKLFHRTTRDEYLFSGSFNEAITPIIRVAQIFGVMPIIGLKSKDPNQLSFKWCSIRTVYSIIAFILLSIYTTLTANWAFRNEFNFSKIGPLVFNIINTSIVLFFLILAKKWPFLMRYWYEIERKIQPYRRLPDKTILRKKVLLIGFIILTLSTIEHILSIVSVFYVPPECPSRPEPIKSFFMTHLSPLFYVTEYTPIKAAFGKAVSLLGIFTWSFIDLFVIVISLGLSTRFQQLNECLFRYKGRSMPSDFWAEQRINYRNLCSLCDTIDNSIALITLLSFSNNLYFICVQLLYSLNPIQSFVHGLYFWFSLIYLIGRTLAVSLFSADIHSQSKSPIIVFRSVPRESWSQEVIRFSDDVTNGMVALSGMKFFYLTRGLVLSVAGTIVTYELVLIQFHQIEEVEKSHHYC